MVVTFVRRHRANDSFHPLQTALVHWRQLGSLDSWNHRQEIFQGAHLLDLLQLRAKVLQGEARLTHLLFKGESSFLINRLLSFLNQGEHVPHPQQP